jgi:hypothetical protein
MPPAGAPLVDESALPDWLRAQGAGGSAARQQPSRAAGSDWLTDARVPAQPGNGAPGVPLNNNDLPPWLRQSGQPPDGRAPASGGAPGLAGAGRGPALPLATAETPSWLQPEGSGGAGRRPGGGPRGERADWSGSRVRRPRDDDDDSRAHSAYEDSRDGRGRDGRDDYGDYGGEEPPYDGWGDDQGGDDGRRRRGFFGRFRRR